MKLKCLACDVLARPLYLSAAHSPHIVDIELFPRGLHNTPAILRGRLQERIDAAAGQGYDAVVMAYGLCGQATAGHPLPGWPRALRRPVRAAAGHLLVRAGLHGARRRRGRQHGPGCRRGHGGAGGLRAVRGEIRQGQRRLPYGDGSQVERMAQEDAARRGWVFERVAGDMVLVRRLLFGDWADEFLVLEPGQSLAMTYDHQVIGCV